MGLLRSAGIKPSRIHDVAGTRAAERAGQPAGAAGKHIAALADASRQLRRDRELAFYGAEDLTPSDFYRKADAIAARDAARMVVERVRPHVR